MLSIYLRVNSASTVHLSVGYMAKMHPYLCYPTYASKALSPVTEMAAEVLECECFISSTKHCNK